MRIAAKCEIELEEHTSTIVLGGADGIPTGDYGVPAVEVLDAGTWARARRRRARAAADPGADAALGPRDRRRDPAGRGRARRACSLVHEGLLSGTGAARAPATPRSRQPHAARARARRGPACARPTRSATKGGSVGRVTSAVPGLALAYVRTEVPDGARARRGGHAAHGYTDLPAPVAQGIERCPAEAEAASSNLAGRMAQPSRFGRVHARQSTTIRSSYTASGGGEAEVSCCSSARSKGVLGLAFTRSGGLGTSEDGLPGHGSGDRSEQFGSKDPEVVEVRDLLESGILAEYGMAGLLIHSNAFERCPALPVRRKA